MISDILSIIAIVLSLFQFIYILYSKRTKLRYKLIPIDKTGNLITYFEYNKVTSERSTKASRYVFYLLIENLSDNPISINYVRISKDNERYITDLDKYYLYTSVSTKLNLELKGTIEIDKYTSDFPVNLNSKSASLVKFTIELPVKFNPTKIELITNHKSINLNNLMLKTLKSASHVYPIKNR